MRSPPLTLGCNTCHTALVAVSGDKTTTINCSSRPHNKCGVTVGFTLIELSIVLVIIGLIVGGVLVGKDLIKSSEIRAQIKQIEEFKIAINNFKGKFGYLPGDMPSDQTSQLGFFTFAAGSAGKVVIILFAPPIGNLRLAFGDNNGVVNLGETNVFWRHLTDANMIPGQLGIGNATNYIDTNNGTLTGTCTNANGCYDLFYPVSKFAHVDKHITVLPNAMGSMVNYYNNTSFLDFFTFYATPYQEYTIETKIDDGMPETGTIRDYTTAYGSGTSICITNVSPRTYILTEATANTASTCQLSVLW